MKALTVGSTYVRHLEMVCPVVKYRDDQLEFLEAYVSADPSLSPPVLFVEGPRGTGKTKTLRAFFEANVDILSIHVNSKDLIYCKSMCQRLAISLEEKLKERYPEVHIHDVDPFEAEDVYLLQKFMNKLFIQYHITEKAVSIYVILDGLDDISQINLETPAQFIALPGCIVPQSKIHLRVIMSFSKSSFLANYATYNIPTIYFPKYKPSEIEYILKQNSGFTDDPLLIEKLDQIGRENNHTVRKEIFSHYVHFLTESLIVYTGHDPKVLGEILGNKWPHFVDNLTEENVRNTVQLYKTNLELFTKPNESLLSSTIRESKQMIANSANESLSYSSHSLCFMAKYLLIAAYLASYLNHRYDSKVFSKKSHLRGGRSSYGRRSKLAHNPRYLQPSAFPLERMLSIFQSIYPVRISKELSPDFFQRDSHMKSNVEVYENVSDLMTSQLLVGLNLHKLGYLHEKLKFRVNVSWDYILLVADSVDFDIAEYFSDVE